MAGTINKPKKPKSKRGTTSLRHKIEKASAAKQRKQRKLAKKNPEWRSKLKKDPGIPNLFPYKERLLTEVEEKRASRAAAAQRQKELARAAKTGAGTEADEEMDDAGADDGQPDEPDDVDMEEHAESNPMAALLASAKAAAAKYEGQRMDSDGMDEDDDSDGSDDAQALDVSIGLASSRKTYDKVFKQVVEQADVILYVLDARDPQGTQSRDVERSIMSAASGGKRLMLVLNKIDLVPPEVLRDWLVYLRRYLPTLPLRASGAAPNARAFNHGSLTMQNTSATLFGALKSFAASHQLKRAVSVGVIGYPNVGKSSVINALLSRMSGRGSGASKPCPAGAEAGVTTSIRTVKIDSKLKLLDSPGVVFPSLSPAQSGGLVSLKNAAEAHAHLVLLNAVPPKQIDDPIPAVALLLRRLAASPDLMQKLYDTYDMPPLLPSRDDGDITTDFLVQVARKRGRLGKGGVPNLNAAAMAVVTDWRDGRIQGWIPAPAMAADADVASLKTARDDAIMPDHKEIVAEWAAEFKLDGLWGPHEGAPPGDEDMQP